MSGTFRSLGIRNYRIWAIGAIVSNTGTWMQRTAQDWLVLAELTDHKASAVGVVMALQFAAPILLLPLTGYAADHFDRRKLLFATQGMMGLLALGLGLLILTGAVRLWQVDIFAALLGAVAAFDAPARQTFVSELVDRDHLANAVGLNSTSFSAARMIGPAVAGVLIAWVGTGWVFLINAVSFAAVIGSLCMLRTSELHAQPLAVRAKGSFAEGFRYVWSRPDLIAVMVMLFLIGTFGLNFAIFISTMALTVFHRGADGYGLLSSILAIGSVVGALLAAGRDNPRMHFLLVGAGFFGLGCALAAIMPDYWLFAAALVIVGVSAQTFTTSTVGITQLTADAHVRGRVMAILMAIAMGGTPIGAPIVGWVADQFGPRCAMGVGAAAGFGAMLVGLRYMIRARQQEGLPAEPDPCP